MPVLALDTSAAVAVALTDDAGAAAGRALGPAAAAPRRAADPDDRRRPGRRRGGPARAHVRRRRHGSGAVHRAARRARHRADARAGARHPGARRPEPRRRGAAGVARPAARAPTCSSRRTRGVARCTGRCTGWSAPGGSRCSWHPRSRRPRTWPPTRAPPVRWRSGAARCCTPTRSDGRRRPGSSPRRRPCPDAVDLEALGSSTPTRPSWRGWRWTGVAAGQALGTEPLYLRRPDAVPQAARKRVLG